MIIEPAFDQDRIARIERLAREIWNEHFTPIIGKAQVEYMLEKFQSATAISHQIEEGYRYFLLGSEGRDIGYAGVLLQDESLFLSKLYVLASQRCKGHGRQAIAYLEKLAADSGADRIVLTVNRYNHDSIAAYEQLGFSKAGTVVQDIGNGFVMDDYRMQRPVDSGFAR